MAQAWADRWYEDDALLPLLCAFLALLPEKPRVLDLCCGAGYESMRMARQGAQVVGLDLSEESVAIDRKHNPHLMFHVGDMLDSYRHIGAVDGIACIAGLVHLPSEKLRAAFERMDEVLKPGGRALLVVREGEGRLAKQSDVIIDGERCDRAFYAHMLEELRDAAGGLLVFAQELCDPEPTPWRNYVFIKPDERCC